MSRIHRASLAVVLFSSAVLIPSGCHAPGKPGPADERPEEVKDFNALYKQNCAACHGVEGRSGIAVSLANPVYIAIAGRSTIADATAKGGPGSLMPAFAKSHGGFLTDAQVGVLADGIVQRWARANALGGLTPPSYAPMLTGDAASGKAAFDSACARCHHAAESVQIIDAGGQKRIVGPVTEPDFLALISDQNLRSTILAGKPDEGMPDWRGTASQPLTDKQATDIVAWLSSQRKKATEQMRTQNAAPQGVKQ